MLRITPDEYRTRLDRLKASVRSAELDLFIVSAFDSIFYLTGAGYEPLERPFFLIIQPDREPLLLTPLMDRNHLTESVAAIGALSLMGGSLDAMFTAVSGQLDTAVTAMPST